MTHRTMADVCREIDVPRHRILYALQRGFVAEPTTRINGCRVFMEEDVAALRLYFRRSPGDASLGEVSK